MYIHLITLSYSIIVGQLEKINAANGKLDFDVIDANLGMELLSIFWNRQHHEGSVVYRPVFMRDMTAHGDYFSNLLLNAMLFAASKYSLDVQIRRDPNDPNTAGFRFRARFEEILYSDASNVLFKSKITTVQALLVMANTLLSWRDETSLAWHYAGLAINMIIELGLHVEDGRYATSSISHAEVLEVRRRIFWAAFSKFMFSVLK